jgi:hypothetical protein
MELHSEDLQTGRLTARHGCRRHFIPPRDATDSSRRERGPGVILRWMVEEVQNQNRGSRVITKKRVGSAEFPSAYSTCHASRCRSNEH